MLLLLLFPIHQSPRYRLQALCYLVPSLLLKNDRRNSNFQLNRQRTRRLTRENRTIQSLLSFAVVYVQELGDGGE